MATEFELSRSYYHAGNYESVMHTAPELLDNLGIKHPEREALVIRDIDMPREAITFGELKTRTEQLATGMVRRGLKKGECVGLLGSTSLEYAICEYGMARTGAILIRFHVGVKSGEDLKHQMLKGNCKWLLVQPGVRDENYNILQNVIPDLGKHDPTQKLSADGLPDLEAIFMISSAVYPGTEPWAGFFEGNTADDFEMLRRRQNSIEMDDIQCCFATSGSTGLPKLVAHPYRDSPHALRVPCLAAGLDGTDRMLLDRSMVHVGGHTGPMVNIGLTMIFVKTSTTVSGPAGQNFFFRMFAEERCTAFFLYPYLMSDFLRKLNAGQVDHTRIKMGITGGEKVNKRLYEQIIKYVPNFIIAYGCTEGAGIATNPADPLEKKVKHTGRGYMGEFKIVDGERRICPVGTAGELWFRIPNCMFSCYWGDEEKTREALDPLGWYKTGDLATMNEEGYITVLGRMKEVISTASRKVHPQIIEKVVQEHPLVESVVAVGVPHEVLLFEEITLCVVPKEGTLTADDLRKFCEERFLCGEDGQVLMPDHILMFAKFPEGATNKLDRKKTREEAVERLSRK